MHISPYGLKYSQAELIRCDKSDFRRKFLSIENQYDKSINLSRRFI
ncbi:MAG: hypothetical protein LBU34_03985 [Planctomycetaceae bacterium]|nr:hypothetical protein [Planctomycetaceae bacterium]